MRAVSSRLFAALLCCCASLPVSSAEFTDRKILYIDSYHLEYPWSAGVTGGIRSVLADTGVELRIQRMDTKRHPEPAFIRQAALEAKAVIEAFAPDVVIASDDNAAQYLLAPYYKNSPLPFVFCGVNWDASIYGFPTANITGMVEVGLLPRVIEILSVYAHGRRLGFLAADRATAHKHIEYHKKLFGIRYEKIYLAQNFAQWRDGYRRLQDEVDMLILVSREGVPDWDEAAARQLVAEQTKVPAGTLLEFMMPYALLGITIEAEEQGEWAARAALRILGGTPPGDIPIARNQRGRLSINLELGNRLGLVFTPELLETADIYSDTGAHEP